MPSCAVLLSIQSTPTFCKPMVCSPPGSSVHGDSPVKNTGAGRHFLLQGIFPTQGSKPRRLHWQAGSLPLSHLGSPHPTLDPQRSDVPHPRICELAGCVPSHLEAPHRYPTAAFCPLLRSGSTVSLSVGPPATCLSSHLGSPTPSPSAALSTP